MTDECSGIYKRMGDLKRAYDEVTPPDGTKAGDMVARIQKQKLRLKTNNLQDEGYEKGCYNQPAERKYQDPGLVR